MALFNSFRVAIRSGGFARLLATQVQHHEFNPVSEKAKLKEFFPQMLEEIVDKNSQFLPETATHLSDTFEAITPFIQADRGLKLLETYTVAANPAQISETSMRMARKLALCCEMLVSSFFIFDDLLEQRDIRCNHPCYHVSCGENAVLDGLLLSHVVHQVTENSIRDRDDIKDQIKTLFQNTTINTTIGMLQDRLTRTQTSKEPTATFESFNMNKYQSMVNSRIGHVAFKLPIACGLILAGKPYDKMVQKALADMGVLLRIEQDMEDVYDGEALTLNQGWISWPIVMAKQLANPRQLEILRENYGHGHDPSAEGRIRQVFDELRLLQHCRIFREGLKDEIIETTQRSHVGEDAKMFLLNMAEEVLQGNFNKFE